MKKKFLTDLKALIAKFNSDAAAPETEAKPQGENFTAPAAEAPTAEATNNVEQTPGRETTEGEPKPEGEQATDEFAGKDKKQKDAVDYTSIEAELQALRQKVSVLEEYTYLKDRQTQLEQRVNSATQNFASALALLEKFFELPADEPAQERKDGFEKKEKDQNKNEFIAAFQNLKTKKAWSSLHTSYLLPTLL